MNDLFSASNLHRCWLRCRARKRNTVNALRFELRLEENLARLERELKTRAYQPARSVCFVVKKPKFREIFAADFKDRIVHHILVDYLERIFEPRFSFDSWACRVGKGTHGAVERLQTFTRQATANNTRPAFYLQLDIKSYFVSIDKAILLALITRRTSRPDVLWLAEKIINNDCTANYDYKGARGLLALLPPHKTLFNAPQGRGLPIGNLTSQFFANVYLNELDQYVKRELKARYYVRYVDDLVLLSGSREELEAWREKITAFALEKLRLAIHPRKQRLAPVSDGVDFLGYIVRPGYMLARRRVVNNFKLALRQAGGAAAGGALQFTPAGTAKVDSTVNSYLAHLKYAHSYGLRTALAARYPLIEEFRRAAGLVAPHYFPCLAAQYGAFTGALSGLETGWDAQGQGFFRARRALLFFQAGPYYVFYGEQAVLAGAVLGLAPQRGAPPAGSTAHFGRVWCRFPRYLGKKYAALAAAKGYGVYIAREDNSVVFDHKLKSRVLKAYVPPAVEVL